VLLFRSSRDGASAAAFHARCDSQGPTLTLIRDTAGNVFGGYTSLDWSSPAAGTGQYGCDAVFLNDRAAFLFTVVNPHADPYWLGRALIQMLVPGVLSVDACIFNYAAQLELRQQIKEAYGTEAAVRFFADLRHIVAEWAK
jgi:hypothetical protein